MTVHDRHQVSDHDHALSLCAVCKDPLCFYGLLPRGLLIKHSVLVKVLWCLPSCLGSRAGSQISCSVCTAPSTGSRLPRYLSTWVPGYLGAPNSEVWATRGRCSDLTFATPWAWLDQVEIKNFPAAAV